MMLTNKELKQKGRITVRKHYLLLLLLVAIAVLFGNEFGANSGILSLSPEMDQKGAKAVEERMFPNARIGVRDTSSFEVVKDILNNDLLAGSETAKELEEQFAASGTAVEGHTDGVLAYVVGTVSSGTLALRVFEAADKITGSEEAAKVVFVLVGLLLYILVAVFPPEIYAVVLRRMFLEARVYDRVPLHHAMHLLKVRRCIRATLTIIVKDLFHVLWSLTIAGFFIKRYSYYLVPYIAAENPDLRPMEAITLSRKMMDGHKMEAFRFEMSFLHWLALGVLTLGLSNVFYYLPYKVASTTEYYACIREQAKSQGIPGTDRLDDPSLFAKADQALLEEVYEDTAREKKALEEGRIPLSPVQKFFAEKLAIWVGTSEDKVRYQETENGSFRLSEAASAMRGEIYPMRLDPRNDESNRKVSYHINFLRCYTIWNLMLMFLLFAFIGWVWEVIVFLMETGEFVNRGSLHGPWVPIYGVGGALILVVLGNLRKKPLAEFFAIIVLCGAIEYFTSLIQEMMFGMRWWDYSGYFLNLDGRICAEGLIAFGVLGMMGIYILAPALDTLFMKINAKILAPVTAVLMSLFLADAVYSQFVPNVGEGITDMGRNTDMGSGVGSTEAGPT